MTHVMIDLETLGTRPGCPVISIGAVFFNPRIGELGAEFYGVANTEQDQWALHPEEATLRWWLNQSPEAQKVLTDPAAVALPTLLANFSEWLHGLVDTAEVKIWGNGANFDNPILTVAYANVGQELPWQFWNDRCYRTVKNLAPHVKLKREGTHHNALDDAKCQAKHLMDIVLNTTLTLG